MAVTLATSLLNTKKKMVLVRVITGIARCSVLWSPFHSKAIICFAGLSNLQHTQKEKESE